MVCGSESGIKVCPLLCGACVEATTTKLPTTPFSAPKFTNITMEKLDSCPKKKDDVVVCWEIDWANENGKDTIYFKKNEPSGYIGFIETDVQTEILGMGDVLNGRNESTVRIHKIR